MCALTPQNIFTLFVFYVCLNSLKHIHSVCFLLTACVRLFSVCALSPQSPFTFCFLCRCSLFVFDLLHVYCSSLNFLFSPQMNTDTSAIMYLKSLKIECFKGLDQRLFLNPIKSVNNANHILQFRA